MSVWRSDDPINQHISARMRKRRRKLSIRQSEAATALRISTQQYQKYEHGKNSISAAKLYVLARVFDVPVSWFYEELK